LLALDSVALRLASADREVSMPLHIIDSLDVWRGKTRTHAREGALIGAVLVGVAGAISGGTAECKGWGCPDSGATAAIGFVFGATVGALMGGFVGSAFSVDRWQRVPLPPAPTPP
jgi:hypothetical protein